MGNEILATFYRDVRDKKKVSCGVYHRASRKGYIKGGVKTQYDFMSRKERKMLNGEVRVMNIYEEYKDIKKCPTIEEIEKMDKTKAKNVLTFIKGQHTVKALTEHYKISCGTLYNLYREYGVQFGSENRKKRTTTKVKKESTKAIQEVAVTSVENMEVEKELRAKIAEYERIIQKLNNKIDEDNHEKFKISISDIFEKEELSDRLVNLASILNEGCGYSVQIIIKETKN